MGNILFSFLINAGCANFIEISIGSRTQQRYRMATSIG